MVCYMIYLKCAAVFLLPQWRFCPKQCGKFNTIKSLENLLCTFAVGFGKLQQKF